MQNSLSLFWSLVEKIEASVSRMVIEEFLVKCVKSEFRKKFINSLDGYKPITRRFFFDYNIIEANSNFINLFNKSNLCNQLNAWIIWGSYKNPLGYYLEGKIKALSDLFINEGDSIAKITCNGQNVYLFLDGHRGDFFSFKR